MKTWLVFLSVSFSFFVSSCKKQNYCYCTKVSTDEMGLKVDTYDKMVSDKPCNENSYIQTVEVNGVTTSVRNICSKM